MARLLYPPVDVRQWVPETWLLCNCHFILLGIFWARIVPAHWFGATFGERSTFKGVKLNSVTFPGYPGAGNQSWRRISDPQRVTRFVLLYIAISPCCSPPLRITGLRLCVGNSHFFLPSFLLLVPTTAPVRVSAVGAENPEQPMPLPQSSELCSLGAEHTCMKHINCGPAFKTLYFPKLLSQVNFVLLSAKRMTLFQYSWASVLVGKAGHALQAQTSGVSILPPQSLPVCGIRSPGCCHSSPCVRNCSFPSQGGALCLGPAWLVPLNHLKPQVLCVIIWL